MNEVREKAKKIIDGFMAALEKAPAHNLEFGANRDKDVRTDFFGKYADSDFKQRFLKNAKNVEEDQIVAEKKKW